jgi:6-phosphogluconolactonase (cycloisomerase 2 family)
MNSPQTRLLPLLIGGILGAGAVPALAAGFPDFPEPGMVYTLSNASAGNQVLAFRRAANGGLTSAGAVASGGLGTGAPLASQGAVAMTADGRWLFAVNAGSDSISSFAVRPGGLALADTASSGGTTPVSLTVHGRLLYVLNQGGSGNISGFWVGPDGHLAPIPGSTRPLSSASASAEEVGFSPDGERLVVTEKATGLLDIYQVLDFGMVSGPASHPSNGAGPYGFTFTGRDELLVTEAGNDSVSAYDLGWKSLTTISASVPSDGLAPCWIAATPDGRYAYAANAHVGTIAGYLIAPDGALTFLAITSPAAYPLLDLAVASRYLYALDDGDGQILGYQVMPDGSLDALGSATGLPTSAAGLAAD